MAKWMAFFVTVWFLGMVFGSSYEGQSLEDYNPRQMVTSEGETIDMTTEVTFEYLFDFSGSESQTSAGNVFFKLADLDYYRTWMQMFLLDFSFLKEYDSGTGEFSETIQSYAFKALGTLGLFSFIMTFIQVIQGFIPGT